MAQFNAGKNPPWARDPASMSQPGVANVSQPHVGLANTVLTQPGLATPTVYSLGTSQPTPHQYTAQQIGVANIQANAGGPPPTGLQPGVQLPQPGIAIPTTLATTQVATISYPTPRPASGGPPQPPKQQRVFTGTVTKLHDNFGFVDEDVFFQTSCVKGMIPKVGDRVLVEASYNANMPFKWNAARIQVLPNQVNVNQNPVVVPQSQPNFNQGPNNFNPQNTMSYHAVKPGMGSGITPSVIPPPNMSQPPPLMGQQPQPTGGMGLLQAPSRSNIIPSRRMENQNMRDRDRSSGRDRDRDRHSGHDRRERRSSPRKRSRSPRRSKSPGTTSSSSARRSPQRRRAQTRIVPRYMVQIPKLSLDCKDGNVIALRSRYSNLYIPSDFFNSNFAWTECFPLHRPFNLGNHCTFHITSKEVDPINKVEIAEPSDVDHLYSAKVMLLANSPMEEMYRKCCALAEDPSDIREAFQHPTRLVQFMVGMKGKSEPMAIGGPWSPSLDGTNPGGDPRVLINTAIRTTRALTGIDLSGCTQWYRFTEIRYHRPEEMHKGRLLPARVETVVIFLPDVWSCCPSRLEWEQMQAAYKKQLQDKLAVEGKDDTQDDDDDRGDGDEEAKKDPSHHSELDPKNMKVSDLRRELEARTLSSKGLKSQLIARLTKALKSEQEKEEQEQENNDDNKEQQVEEEKKMEVDEKEEEQKRREEEERRRKEERERAVREKKYLLPENPAVVVHPSPVAKSGKFECTVMSLSVLLDYRPEDTKEHSFEVSLFAELFNEMLMRDFGFRIYKALVTAPEPVKKEDKDLKDEKEKEAAEDDKKDSRERKDSKEDKKDDKDKEEGSKDGEAEEEEDAPDDQSSKEKETKEKERHRSRDKDKDKDKDSKDSKDSKDKDKDKKRDKVKYCTSDQELLLSFVYFDQSHTGYLLDKDVEEILHTLGLHLSRAQVKKLVQKLVSRDTLNYRKLTDKPQTKDGDKETDVKDEPMDVEKQMADACLVAQGNLSFIDAQVSAYGSDISSPSRKRQRKTEEGDGSASESGMVMYNGAMVDIHSVMQRLDRSEKTRAAIEDKLKEIQGEMDIVRTSFSSSEQNSQKVSQELQEQKKKLRDQRRHTESAENSARRFHDVVSKSKVMLSELLSDFKSVSGDAEVKREDIKQEVFNGD